jgi:hypothetical protein
MSRNGRVAFGLIFGLIFVAGTFASQRIASAADPAFCSKYASDANKAATQAKQLKCGFQGPRWAKDLGGHTAWCLFVDQSLAQSETDARAKD